MAFRAAVLHAEGVRELADGRNRLKAGGSLLRQIPDQFLHDGQHVAPPFPGDAMSLVHQGDGPSLQFVLRRRRDLEALVLPGQQSHGHAFFLLSEKAHLNQSSVSILILKFVLFIFVRNQLCQLSRLGQFWWRVSAVFRNRSCGQRRPLYYTIAFYFRVKPTHCGRLQMPKITSSSIKRLLSPLVFIRKSALDRCSKACTSSCFV
jgi:hypothetical protein